MGTVQVHVYPSLISIIKMNNNEKLDKDCVKLNYLGIRRHKSRIFMNLRLPCLIKAICRSSCCSSVISTWLLRRQEWSETAQIFNNFIRWYVEKCWVSLTCFLMRWEVIPQKYWCKLYWVWVRNFPLLIRCQKKRAQYAA